MEETLSSTNTYTKQEWIAEQARGRPKRVFTSLHHHIDIEWMHDAYRRTRKDGAVGIDGVTAADYETDLGANLRSLLNRIKSGRYFAPPVRRHYIPKADGTKRPLGIPTLEDKVAQRAILMLLEPIYEAVFLPCSYGFRPGRSAHDALDALRTGIMKQGHRWVIDADISNYFDSIDHGHLRTFLDLRIKDGVVRRMIDKWLRAGVLEEKTIRRSVTVLRKRLGRYGLMLNVAKTRYVAFRPNGRQGHESNTTFNFLGFTHLWGPSRSGALVVRQITAKDRFARAVKAVNVWCRSHRHLPISVQQARLARVIRGHCAYYGRSGNSKRIDGFRRQVVRVWHKWLSRRSHSGYLNWDRMTALLNQYPLPRPTIRRARATV